jgi:hypothetical protein
MRNGVIGALFPNADQETEAITATVLHGIITHYAPLPVVCCVVHTLLIREALQGNRVPPTLNSIEELLQTKWKSYLKNTSDPAVLSVRYSDYWF